jgi:hypothetical protein
MPTAEYLKTMFRELERLWPTMGVTSHAIAWDEETEKLIVLFNAGDVVFPYTLEPGDVQDDPIATAAHLASRGKAELDNPDVDDHLITFKR